MAREAAGLALRITEQNIERKEVTVTAVCEIFRNPGNNKPESVGQGCLLHQCTECYLVTADTVIPDGQVDSCEVEFTKKDSKPKCFPLKDSKKEVEYNVKFTKKNNSEKFFCLKKIKKKVEYHSGLAIFFIDLNSKKLKHGNKTCSIFTESPLTISALDEGKTQFCYIGKKRFNLQVSNNSTIEFPDHAPDGLVILQTDSDSTDNVEAVGIRSQTRTIWIEEISVFSQENHRFLSNSGSSQCNQDSLAAPITSHPPSINEPPNPGTASNQRPANGVRQQSLAGAAGDQPDNEPQNPVLNSGTTADDFTDVSHTSSANNEDLADYTVPAAGDTDDNSQRTGEASSLDHISSGFPQHENSLTNHLIQVESEHSATGGASDQPDGTVTENFELYLGSDSLASRQVHVTLASEAINWNDAVNKQLLTGLAKNPRLKMTGFVPGLTPEQETHARSLGIELVDTDDRGELYAFSNSELLCHPPDSLEIEIFLIHSYGSGLGKQAQVVRKNKKCRWVQVVHMISEEIRPFLERPEEHKDEHKFKIGLCKKADLIIAIGRKVYEAYRRALSASRNDKKLIEFVPGIIEELSNVHQVHENNHENFVVLVSGSSLHFKVKGFDIAAEAFSLLDKSYHLIAVLKSSETPDKEEEIRQSLLELGIDSRQLKIRKPKSHLDWQGLLGEVDLLIKPSRTEGFGMSGLRAISASLPVLVSAQCGLGAVMTKLPTGKNCVVASDEPQVWADKIKEMRGKHPHDRHSQAEKLKEEYANNFNQKEQCEKLVNAFVELAQRREGDTQGITQGTGSNESVENTRKKVPTTVLDNKGMQSQTQHVAGCDVVDAGIKPDLEKVPLCRLNMKVNEIPFEVYSQVCLKLNLKRELRFDDFRMLAEKVRLSKEETALIEQDYSNPTDAILKTWSVKNGATVGNFIELLKEPSFDRQDVVQVLQDWVNKVY